jgi:predicted RNA-binding Zn-ribbon protein involved in translation (DUF1610 family)
METAEGVVWYWCPACGHRWVVGQSDGSPQTTVSEAITACTARDSEVTMSDPHVPLHCPKCGRQLEHFESDGEIQVYRCPGGHGAILVPASSLTEARIVLRSLGRTNTH